MSSRKRTTEPSPKPSIALPVAVAAQPVVDATPATAAGPRPSLPWLRVEVDSRPAARDARGAAIRRAAIDLGVGDPGVVTVSDVYWLQAEEATLATARAALCELLADPILQQARWDPAEAAGAGTTIEVARRPGVTDRAADSLRDLAARLGIGPLAAAACGVRYHLAAALDDDTAERLAAGLLANPVVDRYAIGGRLAPVGGATPPAAPSLTLVPLRGLDDAALLALTKARRLSLDLAELRAIAGHFTAAGRDPSDLELEMLAQTWSEHCVHKTFRARVAQREEDADGNVLFEQEIDSMFRTWIVAATERADRGERLRSVFVDNAGIVAFDEVLDLALKVETHNHPSALEPFGGANTGVGGVVRDILGVSARPIANLDVLCFASPDTPAAAMPPGILHPRRIADGVVAGIEDYGNKMGIPTVAGAVVYDDGYLANPLVFCGTLGVLPRGSHRSEAVPGDLVVVLGGRTGRDGLRGATFSSMAMDSATAEIASTSVQIGAPIQEKQVLEVLLRARDRELYHAVTDCGAGGLSSAVGEMARHIGADIALDAVPTKVAGMAPWEKWLSESQERMVLAVPSACWDELLAVAAAHRCEATVIGTFRHDGRLLVRAGDATVADLDGSFLHDGVPQRRLRGLWRAPPPQALPPCPTDLAAGLLALLATPSNRSKEDVIRLYDHEVQGGTAIKPLVGAHGHAPSDAAVLVPAEAVLGAPDTRRGVALAVGIAPQLGKVDPYAMAWAAVDEAVRNLVAVGADPDDVSLLDNFCWGSPDLPDRMGALARCCRGCHDAAVDLGAPFISGKDSLHNEFTTADGQRRAIPGTLLITAMATVPDVLRCVTMADGRPGDRLYVLGSGDAGLGGSAWAALHGSLGDVAPAPARGALPRYRKLHASMRAGLVRAAHDCAEGGVAVTLAEMALGAGTGLDADLDALPGASPALRSDALAFGERPGRIVVAVRPGDAAAFEQAMEGEDCSRIGSFRADDRFALWRGSAAVAQLRVEALLRAFRGHLAP